MRDQNLQAPLIEDHSGTIFEKRNSRKSTHMENVTFEVQPHRMTASSNLMSNKDKNRIA